MVNFRSFHNSTFLSFWEINQSVTSKKTINLTNLRNRIESRAFNFSTASNIFKGLKMLMKGIATTKKEYLQAYHYGNNNQNGALGFTFGNTSH